MSGSMRLVRKPDVWELRVYVGRDASGRVRHRHATVHGSKREAERALARLIAETDRQSSTAAGGSGSSWGDRTTINDALAAWRDNGWEDLSPTTVRRYEGMWAMHVRDSLGARRIAELSPYDLERYFRTLKGKGMAKASVRQVRAMLHRACRLAKKWSGGALPNPVADTELPAWPMDGARQVRAPTAPEVRQLLDAALAEDIRWGAFLRVLAATGMRRGEACALRWSDVDTDGQTVLVNESVVSIKGGTIVKGPKTRASVRRLAIDPDTSSLLERLQRDQADLAKACGLQLQADAFVFSFEPGGEVPPHPDALSHALMRIRDSVDVASDVHLHSLRHFHATSLDPVISEAQKQARLGWSTVHMARHYTDGLVDEDRRAAVHVGHLLGSSDPESSSSP